MIKDLILELKNTEQKRQKKTKHGKKKQQNIIRAHIKAKKYKENLKKKKVMQQIFRPIQQPVLVYCKCQTVSWTERQRQTHRETDRYVYCCSWRS